MYKPGTPCSMLTVIKRNLALGRKLGEGTLFLDNELSQRNLYVWSIGSGNLCSTVIVRYCP